MTGFSSARTSRPAALLGSTRTGERRTCLIEPLEPRTLLSGTLLASNVPMYGVTEISFSGPSYTTTGVPAKDVDLWVNFHNETTGTDVKVWGFYDGNGSGGTSGNVFKVRFAPTQPGQWTLGTVFSNKAELNGEHQGDFITAVASSNHGFWLPDSASPGDRWYTRSDGSHQYITGNTHYTFLSEVKSGGASNGSSIVTDINNDSAYYNKLRFSVVGDLYPNPTSKPFFDSSGSLSDNGDNSARINPEWFHNRVDVAVSTSLGHDMIADLILAGPDTDNGRSTLAAGNNGGDATPYLKYIAARYGSYPNVWITLANEYNIKTPSYTAAQIKNFGNILQSYLPYTTPVSVHQGDNSVWSSTLNSTPSWNDHAEFQNKIRDLSDAADRFNDSFINAGSNKPVVDDELGYQGSGDGFSEADIIEGQLGAFIGGGYGTTGFKNVAKNDQYFWGHFDASTHTASDNLAWLRQRIDQNVSFWKMSPVAIGSSIFSASSEFRAMQWAGNEYVLATDAAGSVTANLPAGSWTVTRFDAIAKTQTTLSPNASGAYTFSAPASRAVLYLFKKNASQSEIILDNNGSGTTKVGTWTDSTSAAGYYGSNYMHDGNVDKGNKSVTYTAAATPGNYEVFARWTSGTNRASNTPIDIIHSGGTSTVTVDQRSNGGIWYSLGTFNFGSTAQVRIRTNGTDGFVIADAMRFVPTTVTAPAAPSGLGATAASSSQINLAWTDNSNNESGFKIERKTGSGGTWAQIAQVGANVTTYQNTGLSASTQYFYRVRSYISGQANSDYSNEANATTQAASGANVTITSVSTGLAYDVKTAAVGLQYYIDRTYTITALSANLANQPIIRTANADKYVNVASHLTFTLAQSSTVYVAYDKRATSLPAWLGDGSWTLTSETFATTDTAASAFRVYAKNFPAGSVTLGGNYQAPVAGADTHYAVIAAPAGAPAAPAAPSALSATAASSSQINLAWTDNSNNESGFKIERKIGSGGTWSQIAQVGANVSSYQNTGLSASTQYYYRVRSYISGQANSAYSNEADATTQAASAPVTVNVTADIDTFIDQNAPDTNNANATSLGIGGGTTTRAIYMRFNINSLPAGAHITGVQLQLYCANTSTQSGGTLRLFNPTNASWSETQPTWNNPLAGSDGSGDLATLGPVTNGVTYTISNLQSVVSGNGLLTFVMRSTVQDGAAYGSSESTYSSQRPTLRITYTL
jgi:hypothetical protein